MREYPILFSSAMVNAILTGSKVQTRRVIAGEPKWEIPEPCCSETEEGYQGPIDYSLWADQADREYGDARRSPFGHKGDRLWVRETWATDAQVDAVAPRDLSQGEPIFYPASNIWRKTGCDPIHYGKLRPAIHMPRWASRLNLSVLSVRPERLQAIRYFDALDEGVLRVEEGYRGSEKLPLRQTAVTAFQDLWESIHGAGSWAVNPWVWRVHFRQVTRV